MTETFVFENELATLAKKYREASGKTRAQAAREMGVKPPSIHHAEENPNMPFKKLRKKMIEAYSNHEIIGPGYLLRTKRS